MKGGFVLICIAQCYSLSFESFCFYFCVVWFRSKLFLKKYCFFLHPHWLCRVVFL